MSKQCSWLYMYAQLFHKPCWCFYVPIFLSLECMQLHNAVWQVPPAACLTLLAFWEARQHATKYVHMLICGLPSV
jgi:hypothetical protein